ncbi:MAG: hypothetical protein H6647_14425 [Anaerolineales bacterium]|nr:hypothetical protein [Anaerolineales bacterium]
MPSQGLDYGIWKRYKVTARTASSSLGGPAQTTTYSYGPHISHYFDDNRLPSYGDACPPGDPYCAKDFWFEMRGYNTVTVTDPGGGVVEYRYYRGMDGDGSDSAGWACMSVERSDGTPLSDYNWLRGRPYEVSTWDSGSVLASRQTTVYTATLTAGSDPVLPPQPPPPAPPVCGAYTDAAHFVAASEARSYIPTTQAAPTHGKRAHDSSTTATPTRYTDCRPRRHGRSQRRLPGGLRLLRQYHGVIGTVPVGAGLCRQRTHRRRNGEDHGGLTATTAVLFTGVPFKSKPDHQAYHTISANFPTRPTSSPPPSDRQPRRPTRPPTPTTAHRHHDPSHAFYGYAELPPMPWGMATSVVDPGQATCCN